MPERAPGRRTATLRGGASGLVAKQFNKMNILVASDEFERACRLAAYGESQQLAVSLYWSVESLNAAGSHEFDAAIIDARIWPYARSVMARWRRLAVVVLLVDPAAILGAVAAGDYEIVILPVSTPAEQVFAAVSDAVQRKLAKTKSTDPVVLPASVTS